MSQRFNIVKMSVFHKLITILNKTSGNIFVKNEQVDYTIYMGKYTWKTTKKAKINLKRHKQW